MKDKSIKIYQVSPFKDDWDILKLVCCVTQAKNVWIFGVHHSYCNNKHKQMLMACRMSHSDQNQKPLNVPIKSSYISALLFSSAFFIQLIILEIFTRNLRFCCVPIRRPKNLSQGTPEKDLISSKHMELWGMYSEKDVCAALALSGHVH